MGAYSKSRTGARAAGRILGRPVARLGLAAVVLAALAGSAAATVCLNPAERDALTVRNLQTRLMVAALSCDAKGDYNAFVTRFQPALVAHGGTMKDYFRRAYGQRSPREMNHYVTELANEASALSIADRPSYCRAHREAFAALMAAPAHTLRESLLEVAMRPSPARAPAPSCDSLSQR